MGSGGNLDLLTPFFTSSLIQQLALSAQTLFLGVASREEVVLEISTRNAFKPRIRLLALIAREYSSTKNSIKPYIELGNPLPTL